MDKSNQDTPQPITFRLWDVFLRFKLDYETLQSMNDLAGVPAKTIDKMVLGDPALTGRYFGGCRESGSGEPAREWLAGADRGFSCGKGSDRRGKPLSLRGSASFLKVPTPERGDPVRRADAEKSWPSFHDTQVLLGRSRICIFLCSQRKRRSESRACSLWICGIYTNYALKWLLHMPRYRRRSSMRWFAMLR
jgi:hypothetical protein